MGGGRAPRGRAPGRRRGGNALLAAAPWAFDEGARPRVTHVSEGDELDLGGRRLVCVALPGHTVGSVGYLCPGLGVLLSGDAVTPIMCLCFEESLPVAAWRATLAKMGGPALRALLHRAPPPRLHQGGPAELSGGGGLCREGPRVCVASRRRRGLGGHLPPLPVRHLRRRQPGVPRGDYTGPASAAAATFFSPAPPRLTCAPPLSPASRARARPCAGFGGCVRERCRICRICALAGAHMRLFRRRKRTHPGVLARRPHGRGAEKNRAPGVWFASTKPAAECPREMWCAHMVRVGAACEGDSRTRRHASEGEATQGGFA